MRAAVFTLTTLTLATAAHVLAGGSIASPWVLMFLACGIFVCAQALCVSEIGLTGLCAGVLVTQLAVHLALMSNSSAAGMSRTPMPPMQSETLTMLAAHCIAAAGVGLLLRRAEAGACALLRVLALFLPRVREFTAPTMDVVGRSWFRRLDVPCLGLLLASSCGRRAPPRVV